MAKKYGVIGFKGVVFAPVTKNDVTGYTTGPGEALPYAGSLDLSPDQSDTKLYYDDALYARVMDVNGYDVTLRIAEMSLEDFAKYGMGTFDAETNTLQKTYEAKGDEYSVRFMGDTVDKLPNYFNHRVVRINSIDWGNFATKGSSVTVNEVVITGSAMKPQYSNLTPVAVMQLKEDGGNQAACDAFLTAEEVYPPVAP